MYSIDSTCSYIFHPRMINVVILLLEAPSVVRVGTKHLMRQLCLATVVDMNFQEDSSTLNMANGKLGCIVNQGVINIIYTYY